MYYEYYRDFHEFINIGKNHAFPHYHKALEIIYIIKGEIKCNINNKIYRLKEGELVVIPPYHLHTIDSIGHSITQLNVLPSKYSDNYLQELGDFEPTNIVLSNKIATENIAKPLRLLLKKPSTMLKKGIYNYTLGQYLDNISKQPIKTSKNYAFINKVLSYIDENSAENITLEKLAQVFNYSKYHFSTLFNKNLKINLVAHINNVRIKKAIDLLSDHSATQTAYLVGYANLQSFYYNFKRITNCTPKEYILSNTIKK